MASAWNVEILPRAIRALDRLRDEHGDDAYCETLQDILNLEEDPAPRDAIRLRGTRNDYRIYTYRATWRILYRILFRERRVLVFRLAPRPGAYSGYDRW